ncbi:MAG: ABC transporter permease, partial [Clostridia bacterium]|nr:ABC transporter permease [Clostridia bacterium]
KKPSELIGMSVKMVNAELILKITGIFKTDYTRYNYLINSQERLSQDSRIDITNWQNNKDYLYSKIFVKSGFIAQYFGQSSLVDIPIEGYANATVTIDLSDFKYDANDFKKPIDSEKDSFLWIDDNYKLTLTEEQVFPNLSGGGIAVSIQAFKLFYPEFDENTDIYEEGGVKVLNPNYRSLNINSMEYIYMPVIALYDAENFPSPQKPLVVSKNIYDRIMALMSQSKPVKLSSVMFERGKDFNGIKDIAQKLLQEDLLMFSSVGSLREILQLGDMFGAVAEGFFYISIVIAGFSFLLILNYMSSSVRFRAKEIAVYRVIGARKIDVAKIFLTESLMISVRSATFSCILGAVITYFIKLGSKGALQIFNLSFSIFSFDLFTVAFVFASVTLLVVTASLLPIFAVTRRKAIEALKIIG